MGLLARADAAAVNKLCAGITLPDHILLRAPEIGGVMVRGRAGATGGPFNLGEMTVTRCSVKLPCGTIGHAYVQGRDKTQATQAALIDALMQTDDADQIAAKVLDTLREAEQIARASRAAKAAATRVDFFTMVRGED